MQAKRYLEQAAVLEERVDCRLKQLARLQDMQRRAGMIEAVSPKALERMRMLESEISGDVERWVEKKRQVAATIAGLEQENYRQLLEYRYLCGWDWRRIADRMHYSVDRIMHLHAEALRQLRVDEGAAGKADGR